MSEENLEKNKIENEEKEVAKESNTIKQELEETTDRLKTEDEGYKQGIELVLKQFVDVLTKFGVEEIKTVGETFDPEVHEAVSSIQDETKGEKEVVQEFRKGYKIGTKVIRHAMVVVAN